MVDELMSAGSNKIVEAPGTAGGLLEVTVGDGDEKAGMVMTAVGETWPEVDICAATEQPIGVLEELDDVPIDDVIGATRGADGVKLVMCGSGARVRLFYQANGATSAAGTIVIVSSEAGKIGPAAGTEFQDVFVGTLAEDVTQNATDDQVVEVLLDV